jgi:ParB/RepB/Spo0J family partition protein
MNDVATMRYIPLSACVLSATKSQAERRKRFAKDALAELTESVRAQGVVQPIVVRPVDEAKGDRYEIVAGERRYLAAKGAERDSIPAVVRELSDEQVIEIQLIENLHREDVHPMQEAEGYHELVHKYGHPIEEIHARVGRSSSYVHQRIKLLALAPKCRKAFYDDQISLSIALKLARIPVESLQLEVLKELLDHYEPMSLRDATDLISQYMLKLSEATFPIDDPDLNNAGPCGACPKRTGNQPELFADIKGADLCTDVTCFDAKTRAYGQRLIERARQSGQEVITGKAAEKLAPRGVDDFTHLPGYYGLNQKVWRGSKQVKVASVVPKGAETTLLMDVDGKVHELVKASVIDKATKTTAPAAHAVSAADKKRKLENKVRLAVYQECRFKLTGLDPRTVARFVFDRLEHDTVKLLCKIRNFEPPQKKRSWGGMDTDYRAVGKAVDDIAGVDLGLFVADCVYAQQLLFSTRGYDRGTKIATDVLELAKGLGVDVAAIRASLAPKKVAKKKAAKRKAG